MKIASKRIFWTATKYGPANKVASTILHGFFGGKNGEELFAIIVYQDAQLAELKAIAEREREERKARAKMPSSRPFNKKYSYFNKTDSVDDKDEIYPPLPKKSSPTKVIKLEDLNDALSDPLDVDGQPMTGRRQDFSNFDGFDGMDDGFSGFSGFGNGLDSFRAPKPIEEPKRCRLITSGMWKDSIPIKYFDTVEEAKKFLKKVINYRLFSIVEQLREVANVE